jgi:hypothetical protein
VRHPILQQDKKTKFTLSILRKSRDLLRDSYNALLIILLWGDNSKIAAEFQSRFLWSDFEIVLKSTAMPSKDWIKYVITGDGHPSAVVTQPISRMLARYIEQKDSHQ